MQFLVSYKTAAKLPNFGIFQDFNMDFRICQIGIFQIYFVLFPKIHIFATLTTFYEYTQMPKHRGIQDNPQKTFAQGDSSKNRRARGYDGPRTRLRGYGDRIHHVKRLREKLEGASDKWELRTVWGVGYKFETKE